jgi:hypothetical protein
VTTNEEVNMAKQRHVVVTVGCFDPEIRAHFGAHDHEVEALIAEESTRYRENGGSSSFFGAVSYPPSKCPVCGGLAELRFKFRRPRPVRCD